MSFKYHESKKKCIFGNFFFEKSANSQYFFEKKNIKRPPSLGQGMGSPWEGVKKWNPIYQAHHYIQMSMSTYHRFLGHFCDPPLQRRGFLKCKVHDNQSEIILLYYQYMEISNTCNIKVTHLYQDQRGWDVSDMLWVCLGGECLVTIRRGNHEGVGGLKPSRNFQGGFDMRTPPHVLYIYTMIL